MVSYIWESRQALQTLNAYLVCCLLMCHRGVTVSAASVIEVVIFALLVLPTFHISPFPFAFHLSNHSSSLILIFLVSSRLILLLGHLSILS